MFQRKTRKQLDTEHQKKLKKIEDRGAIILRKRELKEKKKSYRKPLKMPSTAKLYVAFIFVNCTVVEIFSMYEMNRLSDLSPLYSLITAVVGEAITFAVYAAKSTKENLHKYPDIQPDMNDFEPTNNIEPTFTE